MILAGSVSRLFSGLLLAAICTSLDKTMLASAASSYEASRPTDTLTWGPCENFSAPLECSKFKVPLDYAHPYLGTTTLALIRLPAKTSPRKGYMFYNPGGPGGPGVDMDVLGWDPRGIGASGPYVTFFETEQEYNDFWRQTRGAGKIESRGNLTQPSDISFFRSQASFFEDFSNQFHSRFRAKIGNNLKYIGTCATVRDLVGMVDAIYGQGADVNFYGYSYGALIAAYLTQMFPQRVGKVIADGVLDAYTWARTPIIEEFPIDLIDAEGSLRAWSAGCASSANCTLGAIGNHTTDGVMSVIDGIINKAYAAYDGSTISAIELIPDRNNFAYTPSWSFQLVASTLSAFIRSMYTWSFLDHFLSETYAFQNNAMAPSRKRSKSGISVPILGPASPPWGIPGPWAQTNGPWSHSTLKDLSPHFASIMNSRWLCPLWTMRAVERLADIRSIPNDLSVKPKNVVLVIGNSLDLATPWASAQTLASKKRLGNKARLIKLNAIGHTSGEFT
ncbi:hypothetical protein M408DRAFT_28686 [Serendipita vermifera MAFF 305830]|uniref:Uncharacterized protein n=1 Tax=Serendipita vermifera MAFF 305830 TaxID=933852 RepID=A0A0C3ACS5_SERVB|nr:hypothetical protein M408DRAFT_28686 [Serendipita vermifera MAFF 305830]